MNKCSKKKKEKKRRNKRELISSPALIKSYRFNLINKAENDKNKKKENKRI
jgi:hypothetical protein